MQDELRGDHTPLIARAGEATQEEKERSLALQGIGPLGREGLRVQVLAGAGMTESQDSRQELTESQIDRHVPCPDLGSRRQEMLRLPSSSESEAWPREAWELCK